MAEEGKILVYQFEWESETCPCSLEMDLPAGFELVGDVSSDGTYAEPPAMYVNDQAQAGEYTIPFVFIDRNGLRSDDPLVGGGETVIRPIDHIEESNKALNIEIEKKKQKFNNEIEKELEEVEKEIKALRRSSISSINKIATEISGEVIKQVIE